MPEPEPTPAETLAKATRKHVETVRSELHDIGFGVNTVASRLTSVGVIGVFVILFAMGCYAGYSILREQLSVNREESRLFLQDLKIERERQDVKWLASKERSDVRHTEMMDAVKETQRAIGENQRVIQESQKSFDRAVSAMEGAVKVLAKKIDP